MIKNLKTQRNYDPNDSAPIFRVQYFDPAHKSLGTTPPVPSYPVTIYPDRMSRHGVGNDYYTNWWIFDELPSGFRTLSGRGYTYNIINGCFVYSIEVVTAGISFK